MKEYKEKTENQIISDCEMIIDLISTNMLTKSANDESKSFFLKMVADYNRYTCEVVTGDKLEVAK